MSRSSSILRFMADDPAQASADKSTASVLQRLCLFLERDTLFGSAEPSDRADQQETASECYSCKNYSHSSYLKCAVNPARKTDQDCYQFELKALDWDSSEDNPANYSDWDDSENNSANYSEK
jgi:hypothetical protein